MKKFLISLAMLLLTVNMAMANPASPRIPIVKLGVQFFCMPTAVVEDQLSSDGLKMTHDIGEGILGKYSVWTGILENKEVWFITMTAENGLTCRIDYKKP